MSIRHRYVLYLIYMVVGLALTAVTFTEILPKEIRTYASSVGVVLLVIGAVKLLRCRTLLNDADKAREFDARMSEERTVFLVRKARSAVFYVAIFVQMFAAVVFQILKQPLVAQVLCVLTALQGFSFYLVWRYLDSKY